jgi:carboxypeptidase C (cathepsin A)
MRPLLKIFSVALMLLLAGAGGAGADAPDRPAPKGGVLSLLPPPQTSEHAIDLRGRTLRYLARAGTLSLLGGDGEVTAEVFHVAYTLQPRKEQEPQRPLTFVFNGGLGAASAYLHLGALGPRVMTIYPARQ